MLYVRNNKGLACLAKISFALCQHLHSHIFSFAQISIHSINFSIYLSTQFIHHLFPNPFILSLFCNLLTLRFFWVIVVNHFLTAVAITSIPCCKEKLKIERHKLKFLIIIRCQLKNYYHILVERW